MQIPAIGLPVAYLASYVAVAAVAGLPVAALVTGLSRGTAIASLLGVFTGLVLAIILAPSML
jgi:inner membrane protein involved in colicin E2 resistance